MKNEEAIINLQAKANEIGVNKEGYQHWSESEYESLLVAIEALKTETKKCPICGSDLYEYCFSCCYEGKKAMQNDRMD